jgi:hypothetical protein
MWVEFRSGMGNYPQMWPAGTCNSAILKLAQPLLTSGGDG